MSEPENAASGTAPQSDSDPAQAPADPNRPDRSPRERMLVWGGISLLLVLVAIQGHARIGYQMTLNDVEARLAEDDGPNARPLLRSEVDTLIVGWPSQQTMDERAHRKVVNLSWRGLLATYEINLPFDPEEPTILGVFTKDAPAPAGKIQAVRATAGANAAASEAVGPAPDLGLLPRPQSSTQAPPQPTETDESVATPPSSSESETNDTEEGTTASDSDAATPPDQ